MSLYWGVFRSKTRRACIPHKKRGVVYFCYACGRNPVLSEAHLLRGEACRSLIYAGLSASYETCSEDREYC